MKKNTLHSLALGLVCLSGSLASVRGQVILHPNQISGTVRFNNANPAILSLLNPPGDEGMSNLVVSADSVPPAPPISSSTDNLPVTSRTEAAYQITVDSANPGIAYAVTPRVVLEGDQYVYWFNNRISAPVAIGVAPPPLDFDECVGVVTVQFVTSGGAPVPVDGGLITAFDSLTGNYTGQFNNQLAAGITQQRLYLRGGLTHRLDITVHRGTNYYTDRIESFLSTNVLVTCDEFTTVEMVIPDAGTLGQITGTVDMLGEFVMTVEGAQNQPVQYSDYTTVIANYGPFSNQRWGALPGVNFTIPSSGPYTLSNVVPSTLDPLSVGYEMYAFMVFRTNRNIEIFQTPAMNAGLNPPVVVSPGATVDLGNLFVIDPGYLRGRVLLQGPSESLGRLSLLRGLMHAGDNDADGDGIPDYIGTYGIYWTTIEAVGVDRLAAGATFTAENGVGYGDFPGSFNPISSAYEGQYELALGGLNGESSIWKQKYFSFTLSSGAITNDDDYFSNVFYVADNTTNDLEIVPTQPVTNDIAYCFSEVKVVFRTTSGTFYNPNIRSSSGTFTGTDFLGHPADYSVNLQDMFGTPNSLATASNIGQVVMYLPQGTYTLYPSVTPGSGTYAQAGLQPIDLTVGCGQRIALEPCLQLKLDSPLCTNTPSTYVAGSVRSCANNVASISYSLNGGAEQVICSNCGADPAFAFDINLVGECVDNTLTVTATDGLGGVSSVTTAIHYDATPPVINCPADIVTSACDTNGAVVNFIVTATDSCPGPVSLVCTPPSGSVFPPGTSTVDCVATDPCGNIATCGFNVTVGGSPLSIERAVLVKWSCPGTLQGAENVDGPYTDIPDATSPYCTPASDPRKFFRVKP